MSDLIATVAKKDFLAKVIRREAASVLSFNIALATPYTDVIKITNNNSNLSTLRFHINSGFVYSVAEYVANILGLADLETNERNYTKGFRYLRDRVFIADTVTDQVWVHHVCVALNSIGFGICDDLGEWGTRMTNAIGDTGQNYKLPDPDHYIYAANGVYHDIGYGVYYFNPNNTPANMSELQADSTLVTEPVKKINPEGSTYEASTANNIVNAEARSNGVATITSWIWQIPSGASIILPVQTFTEITMYNGQTCPNVAFAQITVPSGITGEVKTPLVPYAIDGDGVVTVNSTDYDLTDPTEKANLHTLLRLFQNFYESITVVSSTGIITITYLVNPRFIPLFESNLVKLYPVTGGQSYTVESVATSDPLDKMIDLTVDIADDDSGKITWSIDGVNWKASGDTIRIKRSWYGADWQFISYKHSSGGAKPVLHSEQITATKTITSGANVADWALSPKFVTDADFLISVDVVLLARSGETIYYTTDGSDPDNNSTEYTAPITLTETTTVKAIGYKTGYEPSCIVSRAYVEGSGYCPEYQTVYDSLTTKPSAAIAAAQNTLVSTLVDAGIWAKFDIFYLLAQSVNSAGEALKNWKNPGTFDITEVGSPAFVALEGFTASVDNYLNTGYNPYTDQINYSRDSACIGVYSRTDAANTLYDIGVDGPVDITLQCMYSTGDILSRLNSGSNIAGAVTDSLGLFVGNRPNSGTQEVWQNGVKKGTSAAIDSTGLASGSVFIGCRNSNGTPASYSTRQLSCAFIGGKLSDLDFPVLANAIETYMDSNGKGVVV